MYQGQHEFKSRIVVIHKKVTLQPQPAQADPVSQAWAHSNLILLSLEKFCQSLLLNCVNSTIAKIHAIAMLRILQHHSVSGTSDVGFTEFFLTQATHLIHCSKHSNIVGVDSHMVGLDHYFVVLSDALQKIPRLQQVILHLLGDEHYVGFLPEPNLIFAPDSTAMQDHTHIMSFGRSQGMAFSQMKDHAVPVEIVKQSI
jgi:hypothetical protein